MAQSRAQQALPRSRSAKNQAQASPMDSRSMSQEVNLPTSHNTRYLTRPWAKGPANYFVGLHIKSYI